MTVPDDKKIIAKAAATAFSGSPSVHRYWDDTQQSHVDLLACSDSPCSGVTSYATIGLSDSPLIRDGTVLDIRTELVGACASNIKSFGNCLATAAFCVINSGWFVAPGILFPGILAMFHVSTTMKHLMFVPPFLWDDRLQPLSLQGKRVAWLLAVPISDDEMEFAEGCGVPRLEELFSEHQIDLFDINRASVV